MKKTLLLVLSIILVLSVAFTGCGQKTEAPTEKEDTAAESSVEKEEPKKEEPKKEEKKLSGTVNLSGSTSVLPLAEELGMAFEEKYPEVKINVTGGGSSQGVKDVASGVSDIGDASRGLKEKEKSLGVTPNIIAYDGIAVVVHPNNPVAEMDSETITKIFKGEITNWSEVGGNDEPIIVISREAASGTRGAFEELMNLEGEEGSLVTEEKLVFDGNGGVLAAVASKEAAIGYISLGYVDETVQAVIINGAEASIENIKNESYPLYRPFLMCTKGELSEPAQAFMDFVLSEEGQKIVGEEGYITVN